MFFEPGGATTRGVSGLALLALAQGAPAETQPNHATDRAIGVIGGGAAAEGIHLPALARSTGIDVAAVVDPVEERTDHLTRTFGVPPGSRLSGRDSHIDAAILGVPHQLHAPVPTDLLDAGIHVLVEKPMALDGGMRRR